MSDVSDPEQLRFLEAVQQVLDTTAPVTAVQAWDNEGAFPEALHAELGRAGIFGVGISEEDGGVGHGMVLQAHVLRALGRRVNAMGVFATVQYLVTGLLRAGASAEQRRRWLAPLAAGRVKGAFCLTEAGSGTDILSSLETTARRSGGGWVVSGIKRWVSAAPESDVMLVMARTGEHRTRGLTLFIVPSDLAGITMTRIDSFAIRSCGSHDVTFADVHVPDDCVLGKVDQGFAQVIGSLNAERISAASVAAGIGFGALTEAVAYAKERQAFGGPIGRLQAIQHRLVRAGVDVEAAWLMILRAAADHEAGRAVDVTSSMAKLAASKAANATVQVGMELMGANGFELSRPMQRYYRDSRLYAFAPLADDMSLNLVAERWLGLPRSF